MSSILPLILFIRRLQGSRNYPCIQNQKTEANPNKVVFLRSHSYLRAEPGPVPGHVISAFAKTPALRRAPDT